MRVLITGLTGFICHCIQLELEAHGHTVVGLNSDITDIDAVSKGVARVQRESVLHLASIAFVGHGNANTFYEVNPWGRG